MESVKNYPVKVFATGFVVLVLLSLPLFWGRLFCRISLSNIVPRQAETLRIEPSRLVPPELENDPNVERASSVYSRMDFGAAFAFSAGISDYFSARMPEGRLSNVYSFYSQYAFYFDDRIGLFVGCKIFQNTRGRRWTKKIDYYVGPEGFLETPDKELGRFIEPILGSRRIRSQLLYDKKLRRFFSINFEERTVVKGEGLEKDDFHKPIQIGHLHKGRYLSLDWSAPHIKVTDKDIKEGGLSKWKLGELIPIVDENHSRAAGEYFLVLDESGRIDLLDKETLEFSGIGGYLPAPQTFFPSKEKVTPKDVLGYRVRPLAFATDNKYRGMYAASNSREGTSMALAIYDENGRLVSTDYTKAEEYDRYAGYSKSRTIPSSIAFFFAGPWAPVNTIVKYVLENLQPPIFSIISYFTASSFEAGSGYRALFILPNSFIGMLGREVGDNAVARLVVALFMILPSIVLGMFIAWRVCKDAAAGATLDGFTITKGYADHGSTAQYQSGGGMYNSGCSPTVTNCIFDDNYAKYGGGMFNTSSSPTVTDCSFTDNEAVYWGGGMDNTSSSSATITRCIFAGNAVTTTGYGGGAIYCESSSNADIVNCTISKNTAVNGYAGGLYSDSSSPTITNTIFWYNTDGDSDYDLYAASSGTITIDYSDVTPSHYFTGTGSVTMSYNISAAPLFADADNDDFHLKSSSGRWNGSSWVTDSITSPCINGGGPTSSYSNEPAPNGSRINMGAYGNTAEASKSSKYHLVVYLDTDDQEAPTSDMQWQLDGFDSTWRNSAEAVLVDAGNYTIKCQCNLGTYYIAPDALGITVGQGEPISYTRTYKACGYICYICYYYNDFGAYEETYAGWRVVGEGGSDWKNGQKKYVPGNYEVEFKEVAEHDTPSNTNVTVTKGSSNPGQYKEYQRNTFYVDMEYGSNSNKGGSMNKFLTIQKGFDMVTPKSSGDPDRWIYVESNYSTKYEDITFPLSNRPCIIRSYSNLTVRGDHTPDNKPWYITAIGITFEEW